MSNEFMNAKDKLVYDKLILEEQKLRNELLKTQVESDKFELAFRKHIAKYP